jgi:signal transduction histidine kinase
VSVSDTTTRLGPLNALPLACVVLDELGRIEEANAAAGELLGVPPPVLERKLLVSFVVPGGRRPLRQALAGRRPCATLELVLLTRMGEEIPVRAHTTWSGDGLTCVLVDRRPELRAVARVEELLDTVDRLRADGTAEHTEHVEADLVHTRLGRLLEELPSGVVTVDSDRVVRFANEVAVRLLPRIAVGRRLPSAYGDFDLRGFVAALQEQAASSVEATVAIGRRDVYIVGLPATSQTAVLLVSDATEREQREQAERDFVANAAHELQSPLAAIVSAVDVLELGAKEDPVDRERFLRHVSRETHRMQRLVAALLELARAQHRGQRPAAEDVPLRELLDEIAGGLSAAPGVRVDVLCPAGLTTSSNRTLLAHAIGNVAANAARYTLEGRIRLSALSVGRKVAIEVTDTGPGIALEERERVLERFYRVDATREGSGLGLSIARQAVEALDGTLELHAGKEGGTRARITIPRWLT